MSTTNGNTNALVILTEFERKLAACTTLGEAKQMRDEAESLRYYAKTMRVGIVAQNRCALARLLAERRLGEMIAKLPRGHGPGRGKKKISETRESFLKTLEAEGIKYHDAAWWQRLARVPEHVLRDDLEPRYCGLRPDGSTSELNVAWVETLVGHWISQHPTPDEVARTERADEARLKRWDAEDAAEAAEAAAYRQDPVGHLLQYVAGAITETRELLLELQKHADARLKYDVQDMLAATDLLLARCNKTHASWFASIGRARDSGLLKLVSARR